MNVFSVLSKDKALLPLVFTKVPLSNARHVSLEAPHKTRKGTAKKAHNEHEAETRPNGSANLSTTTDTVRLS